MSDNANEDILGIRVSGSSLSYSSGNSSAWTGSGVLNKPIGDFFAGTFNNAAMQATFAANSAGSVRVIVNSQVIPEPEEYALVFALFALGFVLIRRRMQKKRQAAANLLAASPRVDWLSLFSSGRQIPSLRSRGRAQGRG